VCGEETFQFNTEVELCGGLARVLWERFDGGISTVVARREVLAADAIAASTVRLEVSRWRRLL
jgi:hypothetical protein